MSQYKNNDFEGCGRLAVLAGAVVAAAALTINFKCGTKNLEGKIVEIRTEFKEGSDKKLLYKALWENSLFGKRWYNLDLTKNYKKGDILVVPENMPYEPFKTQDTDKK